MPASLELATTRAALAQISSAAASLAWGSSISIPVTALAEGVLRTMILNQVKFAAGRSFSRERSPWESSSGPPSWPARADDGGEPSLALQTKKAAGGTGGQEPPKPLPKLPARPRRRFIPTCSLRSTVRTERLISSCRANGFSPPAISTA